MQVKKFEAPTIQEALDTIKRELGPEAIILQTKKHKRGFGLMSKASVEITAAVSERSLSKKMVTETRLPNPSKDAVRKMPAMKQADLYDRYSEKKVRENVELSAKAQASKRITATRYIDIADEGGAGTAKAAAAPQPAAAKAPAREKAQSGGGDGLAGSMPVHEEIMHLKRMVEELKSAQDRETGSWGSGPQALLHQGALSAPVLQDCYEQLVVNGVDKRFAYALIKKAAFELGEEAVTHPEAVMDQLASEIMEKTEVLSVFSSIEAKGDSEAMAEEGAEPSRAKGPVVVALVGPTGVGKTTTIAKVASEALLKRNLKVGLINLDSYKVAAFDQLGTYGKILKVPFRSAGSIADLKAAIQDFQSLDLVLVDTTGRSQRDPEALKEMHEMLKAVPELRTQLVLSTTTRDAELYDTAARFSVFRPQGIIMSKLDEATTYGAIFNVSQKAKLPLLYFTTGQRVPEDIEEATQERVAALILEL